MKLIVKALLGSLLTFVSIAYADSPLNFNYTATGHNGIRPALIFNDGIDTYIQPMEGQQLEGNISRSGPYYVMKGTPSYLNVQINGQNVAIQQIEPLKLKSPKKALIEKEEVQPLAKIEATLPVNNDLILKRGMTVSESVKTFAKDNGITVNWQSKNDLKLNKNLRISGKQPTTMLIDYLRSLGFEAGGSDKTVFVMDKVKGEKS